MSQAKVRSTIQRFMITFQLSSMIFEEMSTSMPKMELMLEMKKAVIPVVSTKLLDRLIFTDALRINKSIREIKLYPC